MKKPSFKAMFENKVVIVTGGASGIGYELAKRLAAYGAYVAIADLEYSKANKAALEINGSSGNNVWAVQTDVSHADSVEKLVNDTFTRFNRLDYIFNNAGNSILGEIRDISLTQWEKVLQTNFNGTLYGTFYAYNLFLKQGHGYIINISSGAGIAPVLLSAPYAVSKAAVIRFSEIIRLEAYDLNIDVSVVCPGYVKTNMLHSIMLSGAAKHEDAQWNMKQMSVENAVDIILKGIQKKKFLIMFPYYIHLAKWAYYFFPWLWKRLHLSNIRQYRQKKKSQI
jgi:NAD(P)-dependent dehydrogenase (short-subunit alcohol dehydrogenase family)